MNNRTPAHMRWPLSTRPDWLSAMDAWSERTGIDLGTLHDHELPCADCDEIIDIRDLGNVFDHEHNGETMAKGKYLGSPVVTEEN